MGFCYRIDLKARKPTFAQLMQPAPSLVGAVGEKDGWPVGTLQRVPDLARRPTSLHRPAALEALYVRAESSGSFLAYTPGHSTRGVEVCSQRGSMIFRVPALGSPHDYDLAVRLAAATATVCLSAVWPEHGPDGQPMGSVQPEVALRLFDAQFAAHHLHDLAAKILGTGPGAEPGDTVFCFGPRGWVAIGPEIFAAPPAERLERAQRCLHAQGQADPALEAHAKVVAVMLTRSMLFVAQANGTLGRDESVALRTALLLESELRGFHFADLLNAAAATSDISALRQFSPSLKCKALLLAAEVAASEQKHGQPADAPTTQALAALAQALELPNTDVLLAAARVTLAAKFGMPRPSPEVARMLVEAMLFSSMADGRIDALELGTCLAIAQCVGFSPLNELVPIAEARLLNHMAEVVAAFEAAGECRNQAFVVACEVAFARGGLTQRAQAALRQLRGWLKPDEIVVKSALTFYTHKTN